VSFPLPLPPTEINLMRQALTLTLILSTLLSAQEPPAKKPGGNRPPRIVRPGVSTPGVKRGMDTIKPLAEISIPGVPDWQVVTTDSLWVSNGPKNTLHRIDAKSNQQSATIEVGTRPCSGLAAGFGSVWVPLCGARGTGAGKGLARVDIKSNRVVATIPVGPADSEGGLTTSKNAVWVVSDPKGVLTRIDPKTNKTVAEVTVPAGSVAAHYESGFVWVTANKSNKLIQVDAKKNTVLREIEVGPAPRFLTSGGGSIWTVNQGDGTVTRVDAKTGAIQAKIEAGIPGPGGEVSFGGGGLWVTVFDIPITFIDAKTNTVTKQWTGPGGDAIRFGHMSVWLSNLRQQNLWRIDPKQL
jgi:virginiamycin B lyase